MKTTTGSHYSQPTNNYPPSVPLCVYRELTAELQAVQSKLDVITSHNQKLVQENQQLRQEITKVIQSCLELQKLVSTPSPSSPALSLSDHEVNYPPQPQPTPHYHQEVKGMTIQYYQMKEKMNGMMVKHGRHMNKQSLLV